MRLRNCLLAAVFGSLLSCSIPAAAMADGSGLTSDGKSGDVKITAKRSGPTRRTTHKPSHTSPSDIESTRENQRKFEQYTAYVIRKQAYDACTSGGRGGCTAPGDPVDEPDLLARAQLLGSPQISPQQAAIVAVARLHLDPPKPVIGPSADINEWHMAAVGYPYWLWADGTLDPAPVSTTVADLTVRLDAHLQSTTFDLGDGTRLTCTDLTKRWSPAVEPGAASPACGHTYTRPSLPKGKYTITADSTWAVDWSVNGVGGTIPLYQQASTTVPVGELQVLTH